MFGNVYCFFSKKVTQKKFHTALTWVAGIGTFSEVLFSALAIDSIEKNTMLRWCALIVSGMVALQTSLFKDNLQSMESDEENVSLLESNQRRSSRTCTDTIKQGIGVSVAASSLLLVPPGQFIRGYFQMYSMLLAQEIFRGTSDHYHFSGILVGVVTTYFSVLTEGAATLDWLRKKNWMPNKMELWIQTLRDADKSDLYNRTGKILALIGSINMAVLESFSLYLLSQNFKFDKTISSVICFLIGMNLCLQTLAFQGKKFLENFQCETQSDYQPRFIFESENACKKTSITLVKIFGIAAPAFAARFALSWFTIYAGLSDTDHEHLTHLGESGINFFAYIVGLIAAVDNLFSASRAASREVDLNIQESSTSLRL